MWASLPGCNRTEGLWRFVMGCPHNAQVTVRPVPFRTEGLFGFFLFRTFVVRQPTWGWDCGESASLGACLKTWLVSRLCPLSVASRRPQRRKESGLIGELRASEFVKPVAEGFDEQGEFLRVRFGSGFLGDLMPVGVWKLSAIRVAAVGHSQNPRFPIGAIRPCSPWLAFRLRYTAIWQHGFRNSGQKRSNSQRTLLIRWSS